jgi:hypothetical protein
MKFYMHIQTKTDLFIMTGNAPEWLDTYVDGRHSKEKRTRMYCRLVPSREIALVHIADWVYRDILAEIGEEEATALDRALVERVARIERGERVQITKRTKGYATLQE